MVSSLTGRDDDRDGRGRGSGRARPARGEGVEQIRVPGHELGRQRRQPLELMIGEAKLERDVLPVDIAEFGKPASKFRG